MQKSMVVWRRLGKEHGENGTYQVNPPDVIAAHLQRKIYQFRQIPAGDWRWWQASDQLIVERPLPGPGFGPDTVIYYLPHRRWGIVEHCDFHSLGPEWLWYVHLGEMEWDPVFACWVFTDLFCDVIVQQDNRTHSVLDLDDLTGAMETGLIDSDHLRRTLEDTQALVDSVRAGEFPPLELHDREAILKELGWVGRRE